MQNEYSEPGKMVLALMDNLIERIKSSRPIRTDGSSLKTGFVYSQLVLGMPCAPEDYMNSWSPSGGGTVQEAIHAQQPVAAGAQPGAGAQPAGTTPAVMDSKTQKAINAAWKTSKLVDTMLMVTNDDSFLEYPTARHISFSYESIINGMQSKPMPPISPDVQKQIDDAKQVLYEIDPSDGSILGRSKLYKNYIKNAEAYAQAKTDYAIAQNQALSNPSMASSWPLMASSYQQKVDDAYDIWKTAGAEKIERSLDILESVGISMQDHMIAKARKLFDAYNLAGLAGVPDKTPFAYISPSGWADPDADNEGWQSLKIESGQYNSSSQFHSARFVEGHFKSDQSSSSGSAGVSYFGFGAHASAGTSSASWSSSYHAQDGNSYTFHNDSKNLSIELEYALCSITRPWLLGDLFYLRDWWIVGNKKDAVSDGTIIGQVGDAAKARLLPMIPVQFLAIRNLKISATEKDWGGDGRTLHQMYADSQSSTSSWNAGGGGGFSVGFFSVGGEGSHSEGHTNSSFSSRDSTDSSSNYGWSFDGQHLEVRGTQIMAWLSEIVPSAAPLDDPAMK